MEPKIKIETKQDLINEFNNKRIIIKCFTEMGQILYVNEPHLETTLLSIYDKELVFEQIGELGRFVVLCSNIKIYDNNFYFIDCINLSDLK